MIPHVGEGEFEGVHGPLPLTAIAARITRSGSMAGWEEPRRHHSPGGPVGHAHHSDDLRIGGQSGDPVRAVSGHPVIPLRIEASDRGLDEAVRAGAPLQFRCAAEWACVPGACVAPRLGTAGIRYLSSVVTQTWMGLVASLGFATIIGLVAIQTDAVSADEASAGTLAVCTALVGIAPYSITRLWKIPLARFRSSRLGRRGREAWVVAIRSTRSKTLVAVFLTLVLCGLAVGALALKIAFAVTGEDMAG